MNDEILMWYDGSCEPCNPGGYASYGVLIKHNGVTIFSESKLVGHGQGMSNNVAEYSGLLRGLQWLLNNGYRKNKIVIRGDNMMTVMQTAGKWRARKGFYIPYFQKVRDIKSNFKKIDIAWIPREQNGEAHELSKRVLIDEKVEFRIQRIYNG